MTARNDSTIGGRRLPIARLAMVILFTCQAGVVAKPSGPSAEQRAADYGRRVGSTYNDTYRAAAKIDVRKPIGEFEASVLVSAYFYAHISLCGGADLPRDRGGRWVAETKVGYAGVPGPQIFVDKKTGGTYSKGGPAVTDPKEYRKFIR